MPDRHHDRPAETISVDEARDRILAAIAPLPPVGMPLADALGLTLATGIAARADLPPFDNSAMDGYAIVASDTAGASERPPVELRVTGQASAGHRADTTVEAGCAVRIMTGAPIPPGADAVVRFEHVETRDGDRIAIDKAVRLGDNIRPAGEEVRAGQLVLAAGRSLRAADVGLAASAGHSTVPVHPCPRVGILVTGDEIVPPGYPLPPGRIWNSNGPLIEAYVREAGGVPVVLAPVADTEDAVRDALRDLGGLDLLVTTGGVSVGDFDVVKRVLRAEGDIDLWSLRIKPGKPLAFGHIGGTPVIGLPGNPVAAAVAFLQFARPAIRTMLARPDALLPEREVRVLDRIRNRGGRRLFARVTVEQDGDTCAARLAGGQGSAMLTSLAAANALLVVPEEVETAERGMALTAQMLDFEPR